MPADAHRPLTQVQVQTCRKLGLGTGVWNP